ncbi:MAG: hypothetical protein AVDCRST_MAG01-01-4733 [uncultured Rubrobacteraceae bacterium]|uniref:DUF1206 domain-containing protein n=1 Tax=uncultured Rubrobacteraceae bacterium TaxID=349277 RepID=A0A6J4R0V3_9ACTN|nr:MAG: hypothetical protein AVDCRST_MAG01-01-4733 [uncultured Rubrobacteraceae bacterium]
MARGGARRAGRIGHAARGVVSIVISVFLAQATLQSDPDEARGLGGALSALAAQPLGPYLCSASSPPASSLSASSCSSSPTTGA